MLHLGGERVRIPDGVRSRQRPEQRLGQKLIFEAKPGAAGNIGTQEVARAAPDGYTLLVAATNNFVINQFVIKMTFDPLATLAPIAKAVGGAAGAVLQPGGARPYAPASSSTMRAPIPARPTTASRALAPSIIC